MFRRLEETLPPDPKYPSSLQELGFFVDQHGCIRNIKTPELFYDFHHTNNDRHNELRADAMRACHRKGVFERLSALGLNRLYLPSLTTTKPDGPHVNILLPAAKVLKTRKRIVVMINDENYQDLAILAYRLLQREGGLNGGSAINFVKKLISRNNPDPNLAEKLSADGAGADSDKDIPGLIIMNASQLLYSHQFNEAMSLRSWSAMPRKSIYHEATLVHPVENRVEGHRTPEEHIKTVFDSVIKNPDFVAPDAEVYVIAIEGGSAYMINVLNQDFWKYGDRITAMAIFNTVVNTAQISDPALKAFLHTRTREWKVSELKDPSKVLDLPHDYNVSPPTAPAERKTVNWLVFSKPVPSPFWTSFTDFSCPTLGSKKRPVNSADYSTVPKPKESESTIFYGAEALCPTFGGGDTWVGECIFTQPAVQDAVLDFFEDVAQDPKNYSNPAFTLDIPQPTPDNPLELDPSFAPLSTMPEETLTEEQQAFNDAEAALIEMQIALSSTPSTTATFKDSRERLVTRIAKKEAEVKDLAKTALATGGLGADAANRLRAKWMPTTEPQTQFAGVESDREEGLKVLDSEAGLPDTVKEELKKLYLNDE
ncbi:hypothetical protein P280DRAFT_393836 [Massarina eburnea CBS 473.64]|uniref:Arb2 domain-containing protein n=1 Tax=Massarina eburnea CBS 473.64 TaxID=1395130 RepID=A0A6A6SAB7_9PLEO|nr:hypothetical protein P280DRAFT_393836 [Massarina eburnea CBS 473.64]